jgi:hypothetical protein
MARKRNRNKPNATGRNPYTRFARLDFSLLESIAWRSLKPNARALLVELIMLHNGENNGSIYLSLVDAAARLGLNDPHTAGTAFDELQERGFITLTGSAHFQVKAANKSRARTWRLNHLPGPGRRLADLDFMNRQPPARTAANRRAERGCKALKSYRRARDAEQFPDVEFSHDDPVHAQSAAKPVGKFHTAGTENCGIEAPHSMGKFPNYIANHGGEGAASAKAMPAYWWQPDWSMPVARLVFAGTLVHCLKQSIATERRAA